MYWATWHENCEQDAAAAEQSSLEGDHWRGHRVVHRDCDLVGLDDRKREGSCRERLECARMVHESG